MAYHWITRDTGRWHLYYVTASDGEITAIQPHVIRGWYAHFWNEKTILVAFNDRLFELDRHDRATWKDAIEHGKRQGIPERELDFPTD